MNESVRVTPYYNLDAEEAILGAFLRNKTAPRKHINDITETDFYRKEYADIFKAIRNVVTEKKAVELPELSEAMKRLYGNDNLMVEVVGIVRDTIGSEFSVAQNVAIIKALSVRRELYQVLQKSMDSLSDGTQDTNAILDATRQSLRDIVVTGHVWKSMEDILLSAFEEIERRSKGEVKAMPSGINSLDRMTTGFHKGELTVIGARPAVGKSALAAHIALSAAQNGYKVGVVSREMTDIQYGMRLIARGTNISNDSLRTGQVKDDDWTEVADMMVKYSNISIDFMFTTRYIEDLRIEVQNKVDRGELDVLIVDYMQLLQSKRNFDADYLRIAYISKALKDMTVDLNISVIALAQVGRSAQEEMPKMSELRGSGDIEQDADNIIFMHRPKNIKDSHVNPADYQLFEILQEKGQQYIVLNVAKQRQGCTGNVAVTFDPTKMRYMSIARNVEG